MRFGSRAAPCKPRASARARCCGRCALFAHVRLASPLAECSVDRRLAVELLSLNGRRARMLQGQPGIGASIGDESGHNRGTLTAEIGGAALIGALRYGSCRFAVRHLLLVGEVGSGRSLAPGIS